MAPTRKKKPAVAKSTAADPLPADLEAALREAAAHVAAHTTPPEDERAFDRLVDEVWFTDLVYMRDELQIDSAIMDAPATYTRFEVLVREAFTAAQDPGDLAPRRR